MLRNRKASLELSIRAIVIVVLAMVLLGLGLGFIRGMFKDIGGMTDEVSEQIRESILNDLITNDKKISFTRTEIEIDKGDSEVLTVGIRNKRDQTLFYKMGFTAISGPDGPFNVGEGEDLVDEWFQYNTDEYPLSPANSDVRNVRLSIPNSADSGSYFLTFDVLDDLGIPYATKDFFIVVRG
jgi:hypothetical protein